MTDISPFQAPPNSSLWSRLGPGGFSSLLLAALTSLLVVPVLLRFRQILRASRGDALEHCDGILVLGRQLREERPTPVFQARLQHAEELWRGGWASAIVVTGGRTGKSRTSEAEAGRVWLLERGVPAGAIKVEDRSQHTLENLFNTRQEMTQWGWRSLILVSDPLHLSRAAIMARGLGLSLLCSPAEACPPRRNTMSWWLRVLREAYLLHWYCTGVAYSRLIRSEKQLARIT
jgi:uncharacterized SAM-binding protein YcdF (DUF218 family)